MAQATCSIDGCERPVMARQRCSRHYNQLYRAAKAGRADLAIPIKPLRTECSVEGCSRSHFGLGYCRLHYRRVKDGRPIGGANAIDRTPTVDSDRARFLRFCGGRVFSSDGCIPWTGAINRGGYGVARADRVVSLAHRVVIILFGEGIAEGMQVDHLCRNRACVNLAHLEVVTPRENTLRSDAPSAINARKTHCANGHEFTTENTYRTPEGNRRHCRACGAERARVKRQARSVPIQDPAG